MNGMAGEPQRREDTLEHHRQAVARVIQRMHGRLDEELPLEKMAEVAYMSPFHLNRVFREITGVPPRRFLTARRLELAKRLLLTTDLSVTEISLEVGYNSLGTFTRRFGDLVGVAPGGFRAAAATAAATLRQVDAESFTPRGATGAGIDGRVSTPAGFAGRIFVGLFAADLPQCRPAACALLSAPGDFHLGPVPDGSYRLFAAGLPDPADPAGDPAAGLLYESALRGGTGSPMEVRGGRGRRPVELGLRPPELFDPPILLTFPVLLAERHHRRPVATPPWAQHATAAH